VIYTLAGGSVFALDASTGDVLWRRFVGYETTLLPQYIALNQPGADALAVDQRRHRILRLEARTGKLIWDLGIGEPFAAPVVVEQRIYVSTRSGKIHLVDAASGHADGHVLIPQPLEVATGVGVGRPQLYQVAEQDNLYVLSTETHECREAYYIGHRRGTVNVPPVMALGYLFVAENAGADYSFLHILKTDEQGLQLKSAQSKIRLRGQVLVPPIVAKDKVLVVTDRREIDLYEVTLNSEAADPVALMVQQTATAEAPIISYSLIDSGYMWVANNRLAKFQIQNSAGKIPSEWVLDEGDVYLAPLQMLGDVLVHTRRRQSAPGITVAALRANEQNPVWQTEVAVPTRSLFVQGDNVSAVTARGRCFAVTPGDIERGLMSTANISAATDERIVLSLTEAADVGNGEWSFGVAPTFSQVVYYRGDHPDGPLRLATMAIPIGDAMMSPVPFAGGLLAPIKDGTVTCMDPVSGGPKLQPFHPSVPTGTATQWNAPAVLDGGQEFVIANARGQIYRVGLKDRTQLAELGARSLESEVVGPLAATGAACYLATRSGDADTLVGLAAATLATAQQWPLTGRLQWGPIRVGDSVWVATETECMSVDSSHQQRWKVPLEHSPPIGQPLVIGGVVWLATVDGFLLKLDPATGVVSSAVDVGEPLAAGPVTYGERLLVAARSGAVLMITPPGA
jgi:outer membrane protein assembly factor BamB